MRRALLLLVVGALLGGAAVYLFGPGKGGPSGERPSETPPKPAPTKGVPPPAVPPSTGAATPSDFEPAGGGRGVIALVLDDMGNGESAVTRSGQLPGPIALAVLPDSIAAESAAALARLKGWDLLVHLPLRAESGEPAGSISSADTDRQIVDATTRALDRLPGAIGVNNHEGSAAMADRRVVRTLLKTVRDRHLFFLDSRTTAASVADEEAKALGAPLLARDVFLDAEGDAGMDAAWGRARKLALKKGSAIVIAHPHPATLDFLGRELPRLQAQGLRLVKVSALVD